MVALMAETTKKPLVEARIMAGFTRQLDLAEAAKVGLSTVNKGENRHPIAYVSALKILAALKRAGVDLALDDIDWIVEYGRGKIPGRPKRN